MASDGEADPTPHTPASLCHSCVWVQLVSGRLGQRYFRCKSDRIPVKYPPQPVLGCVVYERLAEEARSPAGD